jgi:hypothetical protein
MSKLIAENSLILLGPDPEDAPPMRVLHADPHMKTAWLFNCLPGRHLPIQASMRQLRRRLDEGSALVALDDKYLAHPRLDSDLTGAELKVRDRNWAFLAPLVEGGGLALMLKAHRHRLVMARIADHGGTVSRCNAFELLRRYWRRGQIREALMPEYRKCGGRGKEKTRGSLWLGRVPDGADRKGRLPLDGEKLAEAVTLFTNLKKQNLRASRAYERVAKDIYGTTISVRGHEGRIIPEDPGRIPNYNTLKYHVRKQQTADQDLVARIPEREYNRKHRPVGGRSSAKIFGPGQVWQIDATPWPEKVRSRLDSAVTIGTATVFFVVDAFSQVIVGFYVTLHAERAVGALMALANALSDKDEYLRSIGVDPRDSGFPKPHGCARILSDQGKAFTAQLVEDGAKHLRIDKADTPPFRPELKPEVEASFWRTQQGHRERYPDADAFGQGRPVHDKDGICTLPDLEKRIALAVMRANATTVIKSLPDNWVSPDGTNPTAIQLHEFGLSMVAPRSFTEEQVILALWPRGTLRWNGKHLALQEQGLNYRVEPRSSISMIRNNDSAERVYPCVYNPRDMSEVRILTKDGRLGERAYLVGISSATPRYSLAEHGFARDLKKANVPAQKARIAHERSLYDLEDEAIRKEALEKVGGVIATSVPGTSQELRRIEQDLPIVSEAPHFVEATQVPPEMEAPPPPEPSIVATAPRVSSPAAALRSLQQKQRELARSMIKKETST